MTSFTQIKLTNQRVLVRGTDVFGAAGETVLCSAQWEDIQAAQAHSQAHDDFDTAVEEFYAPLLAAAEKFESSSVPVEDPTGYIVVSEGVQATEGRAESRVRLNTDSIILRLLEQGDTDRLVWVGDSLEVLAVEVPVAEPTIDEAAAVVADVLGGVDIDVPAEGNNA